VRFGPELLDRLLAHLVAAVPGCDGAGVSTNSRSLRAVGAATRHDAEQWRHGEGPVVDAATGDETLVWEMTDGVTWVTAVPGSWTGDGPSVLSVYTDHEPKEDDLRLIDQIEPLLATATAVIEFCADEVLRADQMVEMVQNRRLIEQAKGLVMGSVRCDAAQAFRTLVRPASISTSSCGTWLPRWSRWSAACPSPTRSPTPARPPNRRSRPCGPPG